MMDEVFAKLAGQAVTLAGKAAFGLATKIVIEKLNKVVTKVPSAHLVTFKKLLKDFELKLGILNPAVELIEVTFSKRNTSLGGVLNMTDQLNNDIQSFNHKFENLKLDTNKEITENVAKEAIAELTTLLKELDSTISYVQLALAVNNSTSSTNLASNLSSSRLLQASALLLSTEMCLLSGKSEERIIGRAMPFVLYSLFNASSRPKYKEDFTWKEEFFKCSGHIERNADLKIYAYDLVLNENLNDGRYHEKNQPAGLRRISVSHIERMYYTSSGKLLNIEDISTPVLVLKVQNPDSPSAQPDWLALGVPEPVLADDESSEDDDEAQINTDKNGKAKSIETTTLPKSENTANEQVISLKSPLDSSLVGNLLEFTSFNSKEKKKASYLSLFEYIIRLASVQMSQKRSHLLIPDEILVQRLSND